MINEIITKYFQEYLSEERHISNLVADECNRICNEIKSEYKKSEKVNYENYSISDFSINTTVFKKDFTFNIHITSFPNKEILMQNLKILKLGGETVIGKPIININSVVVGGNFDSRYFEGTVQHELIHLYQIAKINRENIIKKTSSKTIYREARNILSNPSLYTPYTVALANVVYLGFKFEQEGFLNNLYGYLYNTCKEGDDLWEHISISPIQAQLNKLVQNVNFIESHINDENLISSINLHFNGKKPEWFIKRGKNTINNITYKMREVIAKVNDDINRKTLIDRDEYI